MDSSSVPLIILDGSEIKLEKTDETNVEHDVKDNTIFNGGCRGCFSIVNLKKMTQIYYHEGKEEIYANMLMDCFSMKFDEIHGEDEADHCYICEACVGKLRDANDFKQQLASAQVALKNLLDVKPLINFADEDGTLDAEEAICDDALHEEVDDKPEVWMSPEVAIKRITKKAIKVTANKRSHHRTKSRSHLVKLNDAVAAVGTLDLPRPLIRRQKPKNRTWKMPTKYEDIELLCEQRRVDESLHTMNGLNLPKQLVKRLVKRHPPKRSAEDALPFEPDEIEFQLNEYDNEYNAANSSSNSGRKALKYAECLPFELNESELQCRICSEVFVAHRNLKMHMSVHFANHVCEICGYLSLTKRKAESHAGTHRLPTFACPICPDKMYKDSGALRSHTRTKHLGIINKYKCPFCDERFKNFNVRRKHLVEKHNDKDRKYECKLCDKTFLLGGTLSKHVRSVHLNERTVNCNICNRQFFTKLQKINHMLSHSADRNFPCKYCQKCFKRKSALTQHIKIHTGEKKHVCNVCGRAFTQGCTLRGHMRVHEREAQIKTQV